MNYIGEFTSNAGNSYRIVLSTAATGPDTTVRLSGSPFVSSVDEVEGGLYSPIRCGGATIGLLLDTPLFDLYSGQAKGVKATVYRGAAKVWAGWVSPTMYDQGFDGEFEEVQLDCVDGLAVLKNIPYRTSMRSQLTLLEIIRKCLAESEVIDTLFISDNVQFTQTAVESVCERLRLSENCFFKDKDDPSQSDDDVAWSCQDVLAEIMRWLGLTMVVEGSAVYCLDYDQMKRSTPWYWRYDVAGGQGQRIQVKRQIDIDGSSYASSGTRLSLDKIYNKVTVADDFRSMQTLFPTFGDEAFETNITADNDSILTGGYAERYRWPITINNGELGNVQVFFCEESMKNNDDTWQGHIVMVKFYKSDIFRFHRYLGSGKSKTDYTENFENAATWGRMLTTFGASYVKMWSKKLEPDEVLNLNLAMNSAGVPFNGPVTDTNAAWEVYRSFLNFNSIGDISFEPLIIFRNPRDGHIGPSAFNRTGNYDKVSGQAGRWTAYEDEREDCQNYPCVTMRDSLPEAAFGGEDSYMLIKGSYMQHDKRYVPIPLSPDPSNVDHGNYRKLGDETFMWISLKWGDRWLSRYGWLLDPDIPGEDNRYYFPLKWRLAESPIFVKDYFAASFVLDDTSKAKFVTSEKGVYIPAPKNGNLSGKPQLTIYMNRDSRGSGFNPSNGNYYEYYYNEVQILKNFSIEFKTNAGGQLDESDLLTDTVYTNEIDNGSVDPMDEITFGVCTYDGKDQSYSTVEIIDSSGPPQYADTFYNKALASLEGGPMRQEEHMVFKCVTQYSLPRALFECNLKNTLYPSMFSTFTDLSLPSRTFVVTGCTIDWKMESANLKLLEKA